MGYLRFCKAIHKLLLASLVLFLFIFFVMNSPILAADSGKKVGFAGDPAKKRGIEYGFDIGYSAGKKDNDADLKPDPKRHEAYNEPDKYYRYEFGSRASFTSGFKSGFNGGYQKAYGKKVKIIDNSSYSSGDSERLKQDNSKTNSKPSSAVNDAM